MCCRRRRGSLGRKYEERRGQQNGFYFGDFVGRFGTLRPKVARGSKVLWPAVWNWQRAYPGIVPRLEQDLPHLLTFFGNFGQKR